MDEIVKALETARDLAAQMIAKIREYDAKLAAFNARTKEVDEKLETAIAISQANQKDAEALAVRESKIAHVETILAKQGEIEQLLANVEAQKTELAVERSRILAEAEQIKEEARQIRASANNLKAQVEKEKAEYKENLLKEIQEKLGK